MSHEIKLAQFESSVEEIANYFSIKYSSNFQVIRQLQNQRMLQQTPLLQARKALKTIQQENDNPSPKRHTSSRNSDKNKVTLSGFSFTAMSIRPYTTQQGTFVNDANIHYQFDVVAAQVLLQNLQAIHKCLDENIDVPNFQLYWDSVSEFKQESLFQIFNKQTTKDTLEQNILLSDIAMSYIECLLKQGQQNQQLTNYKELAVLAKLQLESLALFLRKISLNYKNRNSFLQKLKDKIDQTLCRNPVSENFILDIRRNNSFLKTLMDKLLCQDNPKIQTIIITCRYALKHLKILQIKENRISLNNAVYLSTQNIHQQQTKISPLQALFKSSPQYQQLTIQTVLPSQLSALQQPYIQTTCLQDYTLVLDLDETLGHFVKYSIYQNERLGRFVARPGLQQFLYKMQSYYELILFTVGLENYADLCLEQIGCEKYFQHKLFRQHTMFQNNNYIKDLRRIGRNLNKTIIVDNSETNFSLQPENGLLILTWINQENDDQLAKMGDLLIKLAKSKTSDVRNSLQKYRDYLSRTQK